MNQYPSPFWVWGIRITVSPNAEAPRAFHS